MKYLKNDIALFHYTEALLPYIIKFCTLIKKYPFILDHFKEINDKAKEMFKEEGFLWYSTVKKTTLFYNQESGCFFKILHPLNLKNKISYYFFDKAKNIYTTTEYLIAKGIKVTRVWAYGNFKKYNNPFFVMKKVEGKSLYDILIREQKTLPREVYLEVVKEISKIHNLGYWLGDAHLSHIFIKDNRVSGIIDIDSIKKNIPFSRYRNLAKDLAGLNHPKLPMTKDDKMLLLNYYFEISNIKKPKKFLKLLKHYTDRRWKV